MRIGVDMDDTICNTTDIIQNRLNDYSEELGMNPLDIINDEELRNNFFAIYGEDIYTNVEIKRNASSVLKRLRAKGNQIIIITARRGEFSSSHTNAYEVTKKWLEDHQIEVDEIVTSAYGEKRAEIIKEKEIDWMIDNDPYNYRQVVSLGKKCLLFDDREEYALRENYVTNWLDVEKYLEGSR